MQVAVTAVGQTKEDAAEASSVIVMIGQASASTLEETLPQEGLA